MAVEQKLENPLKKRRKKNLLTDVTSLTKTNIAEQNILEVRGKFNCVIKVEAEKQVGLIN